MASTFAMELRLQASPGRVDPGTPTWRHDACPEVEEPELIPAAIFDVDGTLVDVSAVRHHVNASPRRFDLFHGEAIDCPPHRAAVVLARRARRDGLAILVVTGRREQWSFHTLLWLQEHGIEHDGLLMRGQFDHRGDVAVKADFLAGLRHRYDIRLAVDDNPAVIRLWRDNGIPVIRIPGWGDVCGQGDGR